MSGTEVKAFLTSLATRGRVSASTQNQALCALLFLYREVLEIDLPWLDGLVRSRRPERLPTVLSRGEVGTITPLLHNCCNRAKHCAWPIRSNWRYRTFALVAKRTDFACEMFRSATFVTRKQPIGLRYTLTTQSGPKDGSANKRAIGSPEPTNSSSSRPSVATYWWKR